MKRTAWPWAFLVLALLMTTLGSAAAETFQITLKFRADQTFRYEIDQAAEMDLQVPGQQPVRIRATAKGVLREQVMAVMPDGTAELVCRFESWQTTVWADGKEVPPDQKTQSVLDTVVRIKVTPLGRVELLAPQSLSEGMNLDAFADFSFIPAAPVTVGQTWSAEDTRDVNGLRCVTRLTNRLERVDLVSGGRVARIGQDLRLEILDSPVAVAGVSGQVTASGSAIGVSSLQFDLDAGVVQKQMSIVNGKVLARLQTGDAKLEMPMVIDVTTVVALLP